MDFALLLARALASSNRVLSSWVRPPSTTRLDVPGGSRGTPADAPPQARYGKFSRLCFLPRPGYAPVPKEFQ
jgi:hypothetical protein